LFTADQIGVLVGLEIRQAHDYRLRRERGSDGGDAFRQAVDIERHRVVIAGDVGVDDVFEFVRLLVVFEQGTWVHADLAIDDEFQPRQADTGVGSRGEVERAIGIADIDHDLGADLRHLVERDLINLEVNFAGIDVAGIAFGTRYRDRRTVNQLDAGITGADHRRNAQFTGDDGRMAGAPATIGDNGGGALHDRFPIRIGHIRNQDVAGLDTVHFGDRPDVAHFAGADALADGAAFGQNEIG